MFTEKELKIISSRINVLYRNKNKWLVYGNGFVSFSSLKRDEIVWCNQGLYDPKTWDFWSCKNPGFWGFASFGIFFNLLLSQHALVLGLLIFYQNTIIFEYSFLIHYSLYLLSYRFNN